MDDRFFEILSASVADQALTVKAKMLMANALDQIDYDELPDNLKIASVIITAINMRFSMLEYEHGTGQPMAVPCAGCGKVHEQDRAQHVSFISDMALMLSAVVKDDKDTASALRELFEAEKGL